MCAGAFCGGFTPLITRMGANPGHCHGLETSQPSTTRRTPTRSPTSIFECAPLSLEHSWHNRYGLPEQPISPKDSPSLVKPRGILDLEPAEVLGFGGNTPLRGAGFRETR